MDAWAQRVLALPRPQREALIRCVPGALPAVEIWFRIASLADPENTDASARARLPAEMALWVDTILTDEGRRRLSGVLRQRRHRARVDAVTFSVSATVHARLQRYARRHQIGLDAALARLLDSESS